MTVREKPRVNGACVTLDCYGQPDWSSAAGKCSECLLGTDDVAPIGRFEFERDGSYYCIECGVEMNRPVADVCAYCAEKLGI